MRLSPIVGYLALGIGLGGSGVMLVSDSATVELLAELGVVFLLFDIGLHFSLAHIRSQAADIFGFGPVQVLAGTLGLGLIALLFGLPPLPAFLVGATLALSSTAVVARLIAERHQQNCPVGLTATAILIFQDVAAIFLLIVAGALGSGEAVLPAMGLALVKAAAAFGVAVLLARVVVRPLFDLIAFHPQRGGVHRDGAAGRARGRVGDRRDRPVADARRLPGRHDRRRDAVPRRSSNRRSSRFAACWSASFSFPSACRSMSARCSASGRR